MTTTASPATQRTELLAKIIDAPSPEEDEAARQVYADWLQSHNDPRGELIAIQCALRSAGKTTPKTKTCVDDDNDDTSDDAVNVSDGDMRRIELEKRRDELLAQHIETWRSELGIPIFTPPGVEAVRMFRRGFIEAVSAPFKSFRADYETLFRVTPVRDLFLSSGLGTPDQRVDFEWLARLPHLGRLRKLSFQKAPADDRTSTDQAGLRALFASPHLAFLDALDLSMPIGNEGLESLARSNMLGSSIKSLAIWYGEIDEDGARALASSRYLRELKRLELSVSIDKSGAVGGFVAEAASSSSSLLDNLEHLELLSNSAQTDEIERLASLPQLGRLRVLDLANNSLRAEGIRAIFRSPHLRRLKRLGLRSASLYASSFGARVDGLFEMDASKSAECEICDLDLSSNDCGDSVIGQLANAPFTSKLTALTLASTKIGIDGARALAASPHLVNLERLDISHNALDFEGIAPFLGTAAGGGGIGGIARCPLRKLVLASTGFGDTSAKSVSELDPRAPMLQNLRQLNISSNALTKNGMRSLFGSTSHALFPRLDSLAIGGNPSVSWRGVEILAKSPSLAYVTRLDLTASSIHDNGARALAASPYLQHLRVLQVARNGITEEGAAALRKRFPFLLRLEV